VTAPARRLLGCLVVVLAACVAVAAAAPLWLPSVGTSLQSAGPPQKADFAVVLAGDFFGQRILKAAQTARDGFVPKVLVSGPSGTYGYYECDLAIPFAVKSGYPESLFIPAPNKCRSTREEVAAMATLLRGMGAHSLILVTSDYHTGRAGRLFRAAAPDLRVYVVAAPDAEFQLESWWRSREGRKNVAMEWSKTVATWFGL
jgi:uncharacterized SAM-binding protein YcdF (DUF218 family)